MNWIVNGRPAHHFPEFIQDSYDAGAGIILHTLTIPVVLDNNGTVVECVAFVDGIPPKKTSPVTLTIIPVAMSNNITAESASCYSDTTIKSSASTSNGILTTNVYTKEDGRSKCLIAK